MNKTEHIDIDEVIDQYDKYLDNTVNISSLFSPSEVLNQMAPKRYIKVLNMYIEEHFNSALDQYGEQVYWEKPPKKLWSAPESSL